MRHIILLLLSVTLLPSCGRHQARPQTSEKLAEVERKAALYQSLLRAEHQDEHGFILASHCDSTLFSGLLGAAVPGAVDLTAAQDEHKRGQWYRRPLGTYPECYASGGSASTISRDMVTGILWWMWREKKLDEAVDLMEYARKNNYIIGQGDPARIALMPNLTRLLAEIIYKLSGGDINYRGERYLPRAHPSGQTDYAAHLQVWQILLSGEVNGHISDSQKERLVEQYKRVPGNPLFAAAYGKWVSGSYLPAINLLVAEHPFPSNRLPTQSDYCSDWILARDPGSNWSACPDDSSLHPTGAELVVIYQLVMKTLDNPIE